VKVQNLVRLGENTDAAYEPSLREFMEVKGRYSKTMNFAICICASTAPKAKAKAKASAVGVSSGAVERSAKLEMHG